MGYHVGILADSVNVAGVRATTVEMRYQRYVHPQFMAARKLSRNGASNRARPLRKTISDVWHDPAGPRVWKYRGKGMQPGEPMGPVAAWFAGCVWYGLRYVAIIGALLLNLLPAAKETANRLLEPWCWITMIVTATDWDNMFRQRLAHDTQDDFGHVVRMLKDAMDASVPRRLHPGQWHLPFIDSRDLDEFGVPFLDPNPLKASTNVVMISAARCARASWLNHHQRRDTRADIKLCTGLVDDVHLSPTEHQLMALATDERVANIRGFKPFRKFIPGEEGESFEPYTGPVAETIAPAVA